MTVSISIQIEDTHSPARIINKFRKFEVDVKDASEAWPRLTADFCRREQIRFDEEGPGWAALTEKYAAWKLKHVGARPILQSGWGDSEDLKGSLTDPGRAMLDWGPMHLDLGTDVSYAHWHQDGFHTKAASKTVITQKEQKRRLERGTSEFAKTRAALITKEYQHLLARAEAKGRKNINTGNLFIEATNIVDEHIRARGALEIRKRAVTERVSGGLGRAIEPRPPLIPHTAAVRDAWRRIMQRWLHDELDDAGF